MAIVRVEVDKYVCERCEHGWLPRDPQAVALPTVCPKCKSPYWNTPRRVKAETGAKRPKAKGRKGA